MIINRILFGKHLEPGEEILYAVHRHWSDMAKPSLEIGFFGFVIPWSLYAIGFNAAPFFWLAVVWSFLAYVKYLSSLLDWYCDTWLITTASVIVVQWNGIFHNLSTRVGYEDIEGAGYAIKGFYQTMLRYGDMNLRLMSGNSFKIPHVGAPKKAELAIARFREEYITNRNMKDTTSLKTLLSALVARQARGD